MPPSEGDPRPRGRWTRLREAVRGQAQALLREHARPGQLGWAVGAGVMVGCSPFFGLHTLLAVGLATLLRLNRIAVLVGSHVSVFPLTPLLLFANAQLGSFVLHHRWLELSVRELRHASPERLARTLFLDLFVGGLLVGVVLGGLLGVLTAALLRRRAAQASSA